MIIPISIAADGRIEASETQVEHVEFAALGVTEGCIEEFLRKNIGLIFDEEEEETLLIVGQQVVNAKNARNDLVALDATGNLVLIEIKRDATDIQSRIEAFEFQAIRYAASLATIKTVDDLVERIFARYIKKRASEFPLGDLTPEELGKRNVTKFLVENKADKTFNARQRIMLVASAFDDQTLSAVAWMNSNGIDIACISLSPVKQGDLRYLMCEKLIPARKIEDYFVGFNDTVRTNDTANQAKGPRSRTFLPRMDKLIEWKIVNVGDTLHLKGQEDSEAVVVDAKTVRYKGQVMSYNKWGQTVTKWSSICIYDWATTENGKTLTEQRAEQMKADEKAASVSIPQLVTA